MPEHFVNDQILESVADVIAINSGHAPEQSAAMLNVVMAETMGMSMYNAVSRQQSSSMVGAAAVTSTCAKMLSAPFPILPVVPPFPLPPSGLQPLPVPDDPSDAAIIGAAQGEADTAIQVLLDEAQSVDETSAKNALEALQAQIAAALAALTPAPPPPPPPAPPPPPPAPRGQAKRRSAVTAK